MTVQNITPCLWFDDQGEQAAEYYVSLFPNSSILSVSRYGEGAPLPAGTALVVEFEIDGLRVQALNGGPLFTFSEAFSLVVNVSDQVELDRIWDALLADGGEPSQCGWLKDRWGFSWQIVPVQLGQLLSGSDQAGAGRAMQAMLQMSKLDIAALEAAYNG